MRIEKTRILLAFISLIIVVILVGCDKNTNTINITEKIAEIDNNTNTRDETMKLTSPVFKNNEKIPSKYTCDGPGISPPLEISNIPTKAKSLVLLVDDPDIPEVAKKNFNVEVWDHWIVFNIPITTTKIEEGKNPTGILGKNTRGNNSYGAPCPPDREHRYFFKLYALDKMLDLKEGSTKKDVETAMQGHIVEKVELIGRYERTK